MATNNISNRTLQEHIHFVGLEKFLVQLEEVFQDCADDLEAIRADDVNLCAQYENARWEVNAVRHRIYPATDEKPINRKKFTRQP